MHTTGRTAVDRPLINIRTTEDLGKVLTRQKLITRQAANELAALLSDNSLQFLEGDSDEIKQEKMMILTEAQRILLQKYANYPTLSEFNLMPNTGDQAIKWGATFGVSLLVGELIIEQVKHTQKGALENALPLLYTVLLTEINNPTFKYMIDALGAAIKVEFRGALPLEQQKTLRTQIFTRLCETFSLISLQFGIMDVAGENQYSLTPLGYRVMLHLQDVHKFITLLEEAHRRLQCAYNSGFPQGLGRI